MFYNDFLSNFWFLYPLSGIFTSEPLGKSTYMMSTFQDLVQEGAATDYHPGFTEVSGVGWASQVAHW
ncbi:hypothetical protein CapIbe_008482 [Capra ibex]